MDLLFFPFRFSKSFGVWNPIADFYLPVLYYVTRTNQRSFSISPTQNEKLNELDDFLWCVENLLPKSNFHSVTFEHKLLKFLVLLLVISTATVAFNSYE